MHPIRNGIALPVDDCAAGTKPTIEYQSRQPAVRSAKPEIKMDKTAVIKQPTAERTPQKVNKVNKVTEQQ